jgi:hypothetical protein
VWYSLPTTTLWEKDLHLVQSRSMSIFLPKIGLNRHFSKTVLNGPREFGGLQFRDLYVEQGIGRIMTLLKHVYNKTEVGKMILIKLHSLQLEAGSEHLLLTDTTTPLPYVTKCWLTEIRRFMRQLQIRLQCTENWNCYKSRKYDAFLMDIHRPISIWSQES